MLYRGSCHCGSVKFSLKTDLSKVVQCNCSICKRKNAKMNLVHKDAITITHGEENLTIYQFGTNIAKHFFCKTYGIYTHHQRKFDPNGIGVNLGCLDELDSFAIYSELLNNK